MLSGKSTTLTYFIKDYNINKTIGLLKKHGKIIPTQLIIEDYPTKRSLI